MRIITEILDNELEGKQIIAGLSDKEINFLTLMVDKHFLLLDSRQIVLSEYFDIKNNTYFEDPLLMSFIALPVEFDNGVADYLEYDLKPKLVNDNRKIVNMYKR